MRRGKVFLLKRSGVPADQRNVRYTKREFPRHRTKGQTQRNLSTKHHGPRKMRWRTGDGIIVFDRNRSHVGEITDRHLREGFLKIRVAGLKEPTFFSVDLGRSIGIDPRILLEPWMRIVWKLKPYREHFMACVEIDREPELTSIITFLISPSLDGDSLVLLTAFLGLPTGRDAKGDFYVLVADLVDGEYVDPPRAVKRAFARRLRNI